MTIQYKNLFIGFIELHLQQAKTGAHHEAITQMKRIGTT